MPVAHMFSFPFKKKSVGVCSKTGHKEFSTNAPKKKKKKNLRQGVRAPEQLTPHLGLAFPVSPKMALALRGMTIREFIATEGPIYIFVVRSCVFGFVLFVFFLWVAVMIGFKWSTERY
jgi:hypothetical protein